jgi:hypothetical protein
MSKVVAKAYIYRTCQKVKVLKLIRFLTKLKVANFILNSTLLDVSRRIAWELKINMFIPDFWLQNYTIFTDNSFIDSLSVSQNEKFWLAKVLLCFFQSFVKTYFICFIVHTWIHLDVKCRIIKVWFSSNDYVLAFIYAIKPFMFSC